MVVFHEHFNAPDPQFKDIRNPVTRKVCSASHIEDIGREKWDAVAGEEIFANYGWLLTLETAQPRPRAPVYWWIEDEEGIVVAVAARLRSANPPAWNVDQGRYGLWAHLIRPLRTLVQRRSTLVCGTQMAQGQPILTRPGLSAEHYQDLATLLLDTIEAHCRTKQWSLVFRGIVEPGEALQQVFKGRRYIVGEECPGTVLDIHWDSWLGYLKDLKPVHRHNQQRIRQQVNRGRRGGVVIEELEDPAPAEEELYSILAEHHYRKNNEAFIMSPNFTTALKKNLGDRAVILVARKDNRIVGVTIHMRNNSAMHLKFVGIANEMVKSREGLYFNITFNQLIERACAEGFKQLYLGIMTYYPKCCRGARMVPTYSWIWEPGLLHGWVQRSLLAYHARRQQRELQPFFDMQPLTDNSPLPCYKWPSKT